MKWIKKWYYLILLVSTGIVYLVCVDWQVYARATAMSKGGYDTQTSRYKNTVDGDGGAKTGPSGSGAEGAGDELPGSGEDSAGASQPETETGGSGIWQTGSETTEGDGAIAGAGTSQPGDDPAGGGQADDRDGDWQEEPAETGVSYMTVEDDYFADAVFIGDSRTVGLSEYGGLEDIATFYASTGLSVHKLFTAQIVPVQGQKKKITVEEALQENTFSKIYLMVGINEMGTGTVDTFMAKYEEAVLHLQELQPDAVIYLQGIMKVTAKRSEKGDYITNEGIEERNERIAQLADNNKIFYLDVNSVICDETGGMEESYTHDGVHLKGKYIEIWKQFLKEHAVAQ